MEERYEVIKGIGSGNFEVAKLVRDVRTKELFAVKFIKRGHKMDVEARKLREALIQFSGKVEDAIEAIRELAVSSLSGSDDAEIIDMNWALLQIESIAVDLSNLSLAYREVSQANIVVPAPAPAGPVEPKEGVDPEDVVPYDWSPDDDGDDDCDFDCLCCQCDSDRSV